MKFLIINEFKTWPDSPNEEMELFQKTNEWFENCRKEGKCLEAYNSGNMFVSLWEISSEADIRFDCPFRKYTSFETYPLFDMGKLKDSLASVLDKSKK
jgi:hypothetical protein